MMVKQLTTTCFGLYKGHLQVVHLVKRAVQYTMYLLSDGEISFRVSYIIQLS